MLYVSTFLGLQAKRSISVTYLDSFNTPEYRCGRPIYMSKLMKNSLV